MEIKSYQLITPTENNGYCVFEQCMEDDDQVFFHMTPAENKDAIIKNGFCSSKELGSGELISVSYAKRSSGCFANLGTYLKSEFVIFAVRFEQNTLKKVVDNTSDIRIFNRKYWVLFTFLLDFDCHKNNNINSLI